MKYHNYNKIDMNTNIAVVIACKRFYDGRLWTNTLVQQFHAVIPGEYIGYCVVSCSQVIA